MSIEEENSVIEEQTTLDKIKNADKEIKIVFCVFGEDITSDFLRSWSELFGYCLKNNIKPILSNTNIKTNIFTSKLNCLLGEPVNSIPFQGKIDYDYILFLNSSSVFSINNFISLMNSDKNIVSGVSTNSGNLHLSNFIEKIDENDEEWHKKTNFTSLEQLDAYKKNDNLLKVDYVDINFMLIKKNVIENLKYPWFQMNTQTGDISGDLHFMLLCKQAKLDVYVLLDTAIGVQRRLVV